MELLKKIINKYKRKEVSIDELVYINELLKSGLPLKSAINLIKNRKNKEVLDVMISRLDKGELIEKVIKDYVPKDISSYLNNMLRNLSFKNSLELALSFFLKSKENIASIRKDSTYPVILLFVSLTALFLFDCYGLDSILNLMKTFDTDVSSFSIIRIIIRIIVYVFYISFIIILCIILYFINPKRISLFYILICKYFQNGILKTYYSKEFTSLFVITCKLGYSTKDALSILKDLKNKPVISLLAFHLDEKLLKGESLKEASEQIYYDDTLSKFFNIASYTTNFIGIMENYLELAKRRLNSCLKLFTNILQISSYMVIGMVIIFIYQVLFLPMQAITSF